MQEHPEMHIATSLADFYASAEARSGLSGDAFEKHKKTILERLQKPLSFNREYQPADAAVLRFLPDALAKAPKHRVLEAIRPVIETLHWQTNRNYEGRFPARFFEREAFTEIIGPNGMFLAEEFRAGLLLMGPELDYPDHNHEASEWYHVLSGTGLWRQAENGFSMRPEHSAIFHPSWQVHAMRCLDEPVLALWSWAGKMSSEAVPV